jgi:hypothetical protein
VITSNLEEVKQFNPNEMVLIKVKMTRADYFDNITGSKSSRLQNAISFLQSWIFPHTAGYRTDHLLSPDLGGKLTCIMLKNNLP